MKSLVQAGVALTKPLPRTPEQESCTVPVQVRPTALARLLLVDRCVLTPCFPTGG